MRLYSAGVGAIYLALGMLEVLGWAAKHPWGPWGFIPADLFGGFVLLVTAGAFLLGMKEPGGLLIGATLALGLGGLYLMVLGSDYLSYLLGELEGWRPLTDLRPEIWLAPLGLPGLRRWRTLEGLAQGGSDAPAEQD